MNILIRCDGSHKLGLGHVVRCLALADELSRSGSKVYFAMRESLLGMEIVKEKYSVLQSEESNFCYETWLNHCISETDANVLLLDVRDQLSRSILRGIKERNVLVVTIDDPEDKRLEADLAFYPPVPQLESVDWSDFRGELYVGWEYVILRKIFQDAHSAPDIPQADLMIAMGGSDPYDLTSQIVSSLHFIEGKVFIVLGSGYKNEKHLRCVLNKLNLKYEIFIQPSNIAKIIQESRVGIISFGMLAYEFAALAVPALYVCLTEDHRMSARLFEQENLGEVLGLSHENVCKEIDMRLLKFKGSYQLKSKIDGLGAVRICSLIESRIRENV